MSRLFQTRHFSRWQRLAKAMRIQQWMKNLLIFIPLLLAHKGTDEARLLAALAAFVSFSCGASSGYIVNDLLDRTADQSHPVKQFRPFAASTLSVSGGLFLSAGLLSASLLIAFLCLPVSFVVLLGLYITSSMAYSFVLKRFVILDVLILAGFYLVRILAGGLAAAVPVSPWLLAFSGFLFLSLAFVKRYAELLAVPQASQVSLSRRGYVAQDAELLRNLGTTSGYLSGLVFALYIHNSPDVAGLYQHPSVLWLICPCLLYWISRVWFLAHRGAIHEDPLVFTLTDPASYVVGGLVGLLIFAAV